MNFSVNSPILFVLAGVIILAVLAQSVFFLVRAIRRSERYIYFLYRDGTVEAALLTHTGHSPHGENAVSHWKNVREVIPGRHQTLALCEDGSVLAAGRGYGQPYAVSAWKNVTQLYQSSGCLLYTSPSPRDCS